MQGSSAGSSTRLATATIFSVSFVAGSVATFGFVAGLADALGTIRWPVEARTAAAGAVLLVLAGTDVHALRASSYSPFGPRRQTPKALRHHYGPRLVAGVWGFDTGLAVTTIRVAAASWGALLLVALGFSGWTTGLAYGLAYAIPTFVLLWIHPLGHARDAGPAIDALVGRRPVLQGVSAASLVAAAGLLVA